MVGITQQVYYKTIDIILCIFAYDKTKFFLNILGVWTRFLAKTDIGLSWFGRV